MITAIKDNKIIVSMPIQKRLSKSRSSYILSISKGFENTGLIYEGEDVRISMCVIIKNKWYDNMRELQRQANYLDGYGKDK